jgi:predicted transglutaminase-like cysteine proteinase
MNRTAKIIMLATVAVTTCWASVSEASFFGLPRAALKFQLERISFDNPVLPPIGHTRFCLQYPADCEVHGVDFRRRNIALTVERLNDLNDVNRKVNRDIVPEVTSGNGATEQWVIAPPAGDCKDYAITKRHELLARGWPSRALLLSEVVVPDGEHHLVLVVRTKDVDVVLDNLNANIRPVAMTYRQYQWIRIETPQNPKFWARVRAPGAVQSAMLSDSPMAD